ncbi:MAG TPA: hypothetical protein PLR25_10665, partial [Planctomycetaceae bacterium]|nr:hypothetical protein [Planctomycetaceae bacterium]
MDEAPSSVIEPTLHFEPQFRDRKPLSDMYACVLVKGVLPGGARGYCYFGIFADTLVKFLNQFKSGDAFNPK